MSQRPDLLPAAFPPSAQGGGAQKGAAQAGYDYYGYEEGGQQGDDYNYGGGSNEAVNEAASYHPKPSKPKESRQDVQRKMMESMKEEQAASGDPNALGWLADKLKKSRNQQRWR